MKNIQAYAVLHGKIINWEYFEQIKHQHNFIDKGRFLNFYLIAKENLSGEIFMFMHEDGRTEIDEKKLYEDHHLYGFPKSI